MHGGGKVGVIAPGLARKRPAAGFDGRYQVGGRRVARTAAKQHVLDKVGDARLPLRIVARAAADHRRNADGVQVGALNENDAQPVRKLRKAAA